MLDRLSRRRSGGSDRPASDTRVILLIDDDEEEGILLADMLARVPGAAYRLEHVTTPEAGLERLCNGDYAAALLDVRLGGGASGLDVLREARRLDTRVPIVMLTGERDPEVDRLALELGAVDFLAKGKTEPAELERALRYAVAQRTAMDAVLHNEQRIATIEEVGRLVGEHGLGTDVLDQVLASVTTRLGFRHLAIYLMEEHWFRLGAQRGYVAAAPTVDIAGPVGQVVRTRRPALVRNVTVDPVTRGMDDPGQELCLPLIFGPDVLGMLLVGSPDERPIGEADQRILVFVADRLAAALVVAHDRAEVSDRVKRFRGLARFAAALNSAADAPARTVLIAPAVAEIVAADIAVLLVREPSTGRLIARSTHGTNDPLPGAEPPLHESDLTALGSGRAEIATIDGRAHAAIPLIRSGRVAGLLTLDRLGQPFDVMAREVMPLIADQVALVIASELEHGDAVTGVRDATTGLFTEGYAAAWLAQTLAARRRTEIADREPLSIALFGIDAAEDADVGGPLAAEEKLQDLGRRVLHRMRASDVVWRQGSEIVAACPGATRDDVVAVAQSVVRSLATRGGSASCARTASAGCASVDDDVHDPLPAVAMGLLMARHAGPGTVIPA